MSNNENNLVRIPITFKQRKINEYGKGYVPCEVSERWLQFPDEISDERYIGVDVMTNGSDNNPKKLCELVVSKEDLIRAINSIEIKKL